MDIGGRGSAQEDLDSVTGSLLREKRTVKWDSDPTTQTGSMGVLKYEPT
jgi:hypothetical protein